MTALDKDRYETSRLLEQIRETVESVDRNVEEILDHIRDHVEGYRYHRTWHDENDYGDPEMP